MLPRLLRRTPQRPLLLKGHTRSITYIRYNREGDLLFTCSKDNIPTVWYANSGERLGTYFMDEERGHSGTVYSCDVSRTSTTPDRGRRAVAFAIVRHACSGTALPRVLAWRCVLA